MRIKKVGEIMNSKAEYGYSMKIKYRNKLYRDILSYLLIISILGTVARFSLLFIKDDIIISAERHIVFLVLCFVIYEICKKIRQYYVGSIGGFVIFNGEAFLSKKTDKIVLKLSSGELVTPELIDNNILEVTKENIKKHKNTTYIVDRNFSCIIDSIESNEMEKMI